MFTVSGIDPDGVGYRVSVGEQDGEESPSQVGAVRGSVNAVELLRAAEGETVSVTPTGPFRKVDLQDPAAVLTALYALTTVTVVEGADVPEVVPPPDEGVVY